jgi:hypothetical protein
MNKSIKFLSFAKLILSISFVVALTACMYPEDEKVETTVDITSLVRKVQEAVDSYRIDRNQQPIIVDEQLAATEIYKTLDLRELYPRYLQEYPENSFEMGGTSQYVLTQIDNQYKVKIIDLSFKEQLNETQAAYDRYMRNRTKAPLGEKRGDDLYLLDPEPLNLKKTTIKSMFSNRQLNFLVSSSGVVTVDYLSDITDYLDLNPNDRVPNRDLRDVLAKHSFYAPLASNVYRLENKQIQIYKP